MAKTEAEIMQFVEGELSREPGVQTTELFQRVKKFEPELGALSLRQFNARFPLQIKRRQLMSSPGRPRKARARTGTAARTGSRKASQDRRDALREIFLRFATDLAGAEERKDVVRVLAQVDQYVDESLKAVGR
jgi:hypothetical protein